MKFILTAKKNQDENSEKAKKIIQLLTFSLKSISTFTNNNHYQIFKKLYFTRDNVLTMGIGYISRQVFIQERTLYAYRQKYCAVVEQILDLSDGYNIF